MKTSFLLLAVCCMLTSAFAQTSTSLIIDGKPVSVTQRRAGIEKVMNYYTVSIQLSDDGQSVSANFGYKSIEGKTSATIESGNNYDDPSQGFELIYKPVSNKPGMWKIFNAGASKGKIIITQFNEAKKEISGTFEAVVQEFMDEKGGFVAGKSTKTLTVKGEFKNLPYIKVN